MLRAIVGYREDLDLASRWWHRLASVVFVLVFLTIAGSSGLLIHEGKVQHPRVSDVEILATMKDVMLTNATTDRASYDVDFRALPGEDGIRQGKYINPVDFSVVKCFVAKLVGNADGTKVDPPIPEPFCFNEPNPAKPAPIEPADIVKYRLTNVGSARIWFLSLLSGLFWAAAAAIPVLMLYYRGFVYVICGPRKNVIDSPAVG